MEKLIEIDDYSFRYQNSKTLAVEHISFSVHKGEFLAIIGPTGAGKTTVCRSIMRLIPEIYGGKSWGSIRIKGKDVSEYEPADISSFVGYVHQDAESQILMTNVEKEIAFPLENMGIPRKEMKERVDRALELVHLEDYRSRHPYYLSGGQRQRVVLATALAMDPEVLILDESVSEIDPLGAEEITTVAKELNAIGKTIVFIEHNMEEVAKFADNIVVLDQGRMVAQGTTQGVLSDMELLERLDMFPPEVTQLFSELKKRGVPLTEEIPITLEDAQRQLARLLEKGSV